MIEDFSFYWLCLLPFADAHVDKVQAFVDGLLLTFPCGYCRNSFSVFNDCYRLADYCHDAASDACGCLLFIYDLRNAVRAKLMKKPIAWSFGDWVANCVRPQYAQNLTYLREWILYVALNATTPERLEAFLAFLRLLLDMLPPEYVEAGYGDWLRAALAAVDRSKKFLGEPRDVGVDDVVTALTRFETYYETFKARAPFETYADGVAYYERQAKAS